MKIEIDKIGSELSENLDKYKWPVWQIFLWLLGIIPSLIYEIWRRYKINNLKAAAINKKNKLNGDIEKMWKEKEKLELERLALPINFIIERQLAFLQANEVFFKNMILKSNDPKFLEQIAGKSVNTFLRGDNNLVNSIENYKLKNSSDSMDSINIDNSDIVVYEKKSSGGGMENTHRININGKNYFTKKGNLFLDKKLDNETEEHMEHYRGNLDKKNSPANERAQLIDTASHGCTMKAFDSFLGLNVLVDTKLIVVPDGYDVFMKSAGGENAGDIFWGNSTVNNFMQETILEVDERYSVFIRDSAIEKYEYTEQKKNRLGNLKNNPLSPELQDAIIKINFLDYLCTNRDRFSTNLFVWKNGLHGIDNEFTFFTNEDLNSQAWTLCIKEDLPNLIPYATQELYKIAKSLIDDKNTDKLVDIYKIFAKTANEENLLQGAENIRTRAKELYDHFKWLEEKGRILNSVKGFNSETAIDITEKSLVLNKTKDNLVNNDIESIWLAPEKEIENAIGTATGMGVLGWINPEIQKINKSQPKQENGLSVIQEENEDQDDKYDKGDIF